MAIKNIMFFMFFLFCISYVFGLSCPDAASTGNGGGAQSCRPCLSQTSEPACNWCFTGSIGYCVEKASANENCPLYLSGAKLISTVEGCNDCKLAPAADACSLPKGASVPNGPTGDRCPAVNDGKKAALDASNPTERCIQESVARDGYACYAAVRSYLCASSCRWCNANHGSVDLLYPTQLCDSVCRSLKASCPLTWVSCAMDVTIKPLCAATNNTAICAPAYEYLGLYTPAGVYPPTSAPTSAPTLPPTTAPTPSPTVFMATPQATTAAGTTTLGATTTGTEPPGTTGEPTSAPTPAPTPAPTTAPTLSPTTGPTPVPQPALPDYVGVAAGEQLTFTGSLFPLVGSAWNVLRGPGDLGSAAEDAAVVVGGAVTLSGPLTMTYVDGAQPKNNSFVPIVRSLRGNQAITGSFDSAVFKLDDANLLVVAQRTRRINGTFGIDVTVRRVGFSVAADGSVQVDAWTLMNPPTSANGAVTLRLPLNLAQPIGVAGDLDLAGVTLVLKYSGTPSDQNPASPPQLSVSGEASVAGASLTVDLPTGLPSENVTLLTVSSQTGDVVGLFSVVDVPGLVDPKRPCDRFSVLQQLDGAGALHLSLVRDKITSTDCFQNPSLCPCLFNGGRIAGFLVVDSGAGTASWERIPFALLLLTFLFAVANVV